MKIMRAIKSFRIAAKGGKRRGFVEGDLVPHTHPLVRHFPAFFEPVEDFVARNHPDLAAVEDPGESPKRRPGRQAGAKTKPKPTAEVASEKEEADGQE